MACISGRTHLPTHSYASSKVRTAANLGNAVSPRNHASIRPIGTKRTPSLLSHRRRRENWPSPTVPRSWTPRGSGTTLWHVYTTTLMGASPHHRLACISRLSPHLMRWAHWLRNAQKMRPASDLRRAAWTPDVRIRMLPLHGGQPGPGHTPCNGSRGVGFAQTPASCYGSGKANSGASQAPWLRAFEGRSGTPGQRRAAGSRHGCSCRLAPPLVPSCPGGATRGRLELVCAGRWAGSRPSGACS